ncbi:hypothetical protein Tco_0750817 [Tanacetum coccineum]|uniref:Uncharacterized protein n=1 Tax=Tanacetum coccineum TaxID=301880 RepID=A0ABQ4Z3E8_9ASTR
MVVVGETAFGRPLKRLAIECNWPSKRHSETEHACLIEVVEDVSGKTLTKNDFSLSISHLKFVFLFTEFIIKFQSLVQGHSTES